MNPWTETLTTDVVARYKAGESPGEIAQRFNLTRNQVGSKLDRLGLRRSPPATPKAERPRQVSRQSGAYGNMAARFSTLDAFRRLLRSGPKTAADLAEMTDIAPHDVTGHLRRLVDLGEVERIKSKGRHSTYVFVKPAEPTPSRAMLRSMEDSYVAARKLGIGARDQAQRMKLTQSAAERFEDSYRAQTTSNSSLDSSCPRFAHDDQHLAALAKLGSFPGWPSLAELRGRA